MSDGACFYPLGTVPEIVKEKRLMYKLIIVDDEKNIREGLYAYFKSYDGGFAVGGTFENAAKALDWLRENDCDIILTDIRMDSMSGLDLARAVYEKKYPAKVVLISGYREFEYAKTALQYQVFDYLLKPVRFDVLDELCEKLKKQLDEEHKKDCSAKRDVMEKFLENQIIMETDAGLYGGSEAFYERVESLGLSKEWADSPCIRIGLATGENEKRIQNKLKECIKTVCTKTFAAKNIKCCALWGTEEFVNLFVYCAERKRAEEFFVSAKNLLAAGLKSIEEMFAAKVRVERCECFESMAQYAVYSSRTDREEQISKIERLIMAAIAEEDTKTMESLMMIFAMHISKSGNTHEFAELKDFLRLLESPADSGEKDVAGGDITDIVKNALENPVEEMHGNIMTKALEYIDENYNRELSVSEVADRVYFNPVYFGRLFKIYKGESFTDYLITKRLEKAKELLGQGAKISETAAAVGYENTKYFIRLFKKREGMTPGAYQKNANM